MRIKNSSERYGVIAIFLHWIMALLVLTMIPLGLIMVELPNSAQKLKLFGLHKELGVLILALIIVRLSWRIINWVPALPMYMPSWEKLAARAVHLAFYFFLFAMPITGWMMSSAAGLPVSFFGLFVLPDIVPANENLQNFFANVHETFAYILIALICLHVAAAFRHYFKYHDDVLKRMIEP